jgi:glycosyltransferase involved in cell wall biosynthesis
MSAPFFSVIIPVYNRAGPLDRALRSVLAQTCQDFEIVVVDDGSADDPRTVANSFADPRIRFFRQDNAGGGAARNAAIDAARGRFVAPLDSDDIFLPHHLERMRALLDGTDGSVVGYARIRVDRGRGRTILKPPRAIRADEHMATYLLAERGFVPTITIAVEHQTAKRIRYDWALRTAEDTDFALRLFMAGCRFHMIEEPGAVWMDLADPSRTSAARRSQRFGDWLTQLRPVIPARAFHGGRGWAYAKLIAREHPFRALGLYLNAVSRGCYAPGLAVVVFLQIFLGGLYRNVADHAIRFLKVGLREPSPKDSARSLERA